MFSQEELLSGIQLGLLENCLDREPLLRKALDLRRSPATFGALLRYLAGRDARAAAVTAREWHEEFPADEEPILHLIGDAERRKDWKGALELLERAEAGKHLAPGIRGRRFSVLLSQAEDHIRKGHGTVALAALLLAGKEPQAADRDVEAILESLIWAALLCGRKPDSDGAARSRRRVEELTRSRLFADILLTTAGKLPRTEPVAWPASPAASDPAEAFEAILRTTRAVLRLGRPLTVPMGVVASADAHVDHASSADLAEICTASGALAWPRLTYRVSTRCLAQEGPFLARVLVARALSLMTRWGDADVEERLVGCLLAARALAQRGRDEVALRTVTLAVEKFEQGFGHACALHGHGGEELPSEEAVRRLVEAERGIVDFEGEGPAFGPKSWKGGRSLRKAPKGGSRKPRKRLLDDMTWDLFGEDE